MQASGHHSCDRDHPESGGCPQPPTTRSRPRLFSSPLCWRGTALNASGGESGPLPPLVRRPSLHRERSHQEHMSKYYGHEQTRVRPGTVLRKRRGTLQPRGTHPYKHARLRLRPPPSCNSDKQTVAGCVVRIHCCHPEARDAELLLLPSCLPPTRKPAPGARACLSKSPKPCQSPPSAPRQ